MKPIIDIEKVEKPFVARLGFDKLIDSYRTQAGATSSPNAILSESVLSGLKHEQKLYEGVLFDEDWKKYSADIEYLTDPLFPGPLRTNEIKVAIAPLSSRVLRCTERFKNIFKNSEALYTTDFKDMDEDEIYIKLCMFILNFYYKIDVKVKVPPVYPIQDNNGIIKYYKSAFNADFINIIPVSKAPQITPDILEQIEGNYNNISFWKNIFPPNSWEISGFGIINFTDVSNEEALSRIKNILIDNKVKSQTEEFQTQMNGFLSTLFNIKNIACSFVVFDPNKKSFNHIEEHGHCWSMNGIESDSVDNMFCSYGYDLIFNSRESFIISDIDSISAEGLEVPMYSRMKDGGVKSFILTPIYYDNQLLGIMEYTSTVAGAFQRKHITKIDRMLSLATTSIKSYIDEMESEKSSLIQKEFTSIHPSVEWRFFEEAESYLKAKTLGQEYNINKIIFHDLVALFGQMDISGSSSARNNAIAADLKSQITNVKRIVNEICSRIKMPLLESLQYQIGIIYEKLSSDLAAGMEQEVIEFLRNSINPLFEQVRLRDQELEMIIAQYFEGLEEDMDIVYDKRKDYDETVKMINMHLSGKLDKAQEAAQLIFPHYFERYKTDGVEHNMFIGQEIAPSLPYHKLYLDNLRLWQLKTMCQLEIEHHIKRETYPMPLKVASLIMVYSNPLAIRYRMDEKQFDVDGAYNARYEIIKKRIDKAHIKGTTERITQPGKIVLIYTQATDLDEYLNHINFLTYEGYLKGDPEIFDIEDLQGVVGLKGLRVAVNFEKTIDQDLSTSGSAQEIQEKQTA